MNNAAAVVKSSRRSSTAAILTIDLGTTYFKISLFGGNGSLVNSCRIAPSVVCDQTRMELHADAFCDDIRRGIGELKNQNAGEMANVAAISFATQTNSFVLLDADGRPVTPIILWPDGRAAALETEMRQLCETGDFRIATGVPQLDSEFAIAKLLWLQRHESKLWKQAAKAILISDYLTFLFTGKYVSEAGAAGLTGLLDIHQCRWRREILNAFDLEESQLAEVVRAGTDLGPITPQAAEKFGLPATCRFIVGCLDQYAGAIGAGNVGPGMVSETTGTVLATVLCADCFANNPGSGVFQGPAFREGLYWRMVFGNVSANYLQWYRDQLPDRPEFDALTALAAQEESDAGGLKLRTDVPLTMPNNVFGNLTPHHTRGQFVRCILETVAAALRNQVATLCNGVKPADIRCVGGAARSDLWLQIKADALGLPTCATECSEPTSLGAAILAAAALTGEDVAAIAQRWVHLKPWHRPDLQCRP